jgi:hypothetical protein
MGFITKLLSRIVIAITPGGNATIKEFERMKKEDPELAKDLESFDESYKVINKSMDDLCKRHPDHPACKNR